jgi:hypothetical protein
LASASRSATSAADETAGADVATAAVELAAALLWLAKVEAVGVAETPGVDVPLGLGDLVVQPSIAPTRAAAPASRRNSRRSMGILTVDVGRWNESVPVDAAGRGLGARDERGILRRCD